MGACVTAFSVARCSMGVAPMALIITPEKRVFIGVLPLASILDFKPFANVVPFVLCRSPINPVVAAIIASSLGSVTVGPCVPCVVCPWTPGNPRTLVGGMPVVTQSSKAICAFGGMITVNPTQFQTTS